MVRPVNHLTTIIITARKKWSGPLSKPIIESAVVRDYWSLIIAKMERQNTTTNVESAAKPTVLPATWLDINKHIGLWMIRKPKNVQFAGKSTFPCRPMPCIYELTIKIANAPFVAKLSRGLGCFKATYEPTQVLKISILFSSAFSSIGFPPFQVKGLISAIFVRKPLPTNQICGHILKRTRTPNLSSVGIAGKHLPSNPTFTNTRKLHAINQNKYQYFALTDFQ